MAMPTVSQPITTVEALLALPDDGLRHELLDGEHVVTPAPALAHQRAVRLLMYALQLYLSHQFDVELFTSPADVILGPIPVLAIEILSPGTAARDRGKKRVIYQREGVAEYWIVDLDARLVERWRPDDERPEILRERLEWRATKGAPFELGLQQFFGAVWEDA